VIGDGVLAEQSEDARRDRRDEHEPGHTLVGTLDAASADRVDPGAYESHDVAPEVRGDGDECSEVQRDVERLVEAVVLLEVRPVSGPRHEDEMTRGGDRQELREPLDDAEDECLTVRQRRRVVPRSEDREDGRDSERHSRDAEDDGAAHSRDPTQTPRG
jgi:hypothetical protein